eukprot:TRINITY_DN43761_c0_g1_i3.p3 TRINITY_DN43761_c0_g1~~TRINITY_DN43761_c0_g1_i3.p3  ORF type:complete len:100 (-),score=25.87 TRINITY_DN43761_c0_g1_i3:376-675(-)
MKVSNGERPARPSSCPPTVYRVMEKCWAGNLKQRPTISEVAGLLEGLDAVTLQLEIEDEQQSSSSEDESESEEEQAGLTIMDFPINQTHANPISEATEI